MDVLENSITDLQISTFKENEETITVRPGPSEIIMNQLQSLSIYDDVISSKHTDQIVEENVRLKNHVRQIKTCYEAHSLTLHKIIYLLKKQNTLQKSCIATDLTQRVESLNIQSQCQSELEDLKEEQETLSKILMTQNAQIEEKDVSFLSLTSDLCGTKNKINQLENCKVAHEEEIKLLSSELIYLSDKLKTLTDSYEQMEQSHSQLQAAFREQAETLEQSRHENCMYNRMLQEMTNAPPLPRIPEQPWIVGAEEIDVTNQLLGTGAWGTVSLGSFRGLTVAVKQLHNMIISRHNQAKFLREMEISATVRHPHIVQFICCAQQDRLLYVVTEVMEMSAREAYLSQSIDKLQSLKVLLHAGLALQYLHSVKPDPIIHRDISSCNVLLSRKGQNWIAKLSDFGAANFLRENLSANPGAAIYGAPEAFSTQQNAHLDVYSFGVLMIELMTHELPDPALRTQHMSNIDHEELHGLISQSLSQRPQERPEIRTVVTSLRVRLNLPAGQIADCI